MNYLFLFLTAFIQNMAFTWVSRSRNGGNLQYHTIAATFSNMIWFACNYFILFPEMTRILHDGDWWNKITLMVVYTAATVLGSVAMMAVNLGRLRVPKWLNFLVETGNKKVGSR